MKKNIIKIMAMLLCFATTSTLLSCDRDDDNNEGTINASIVGTWGCTSGTKYIRSIVTNTGALDFEREEDCRGTVAVFNADGTYSTTGVKIFSEKNGSWMIDGNKLIVGGWMKELEIQELSNTTLKLYFTHEGPSTGDPGYTVFYEYKYTFTRQ